MIVLRGSIREAVDSAWQGDKTTRIVCGLLVRRTAVISLYCRGDFLVVSEREKYKSLLLYFRTRETNLGLKPFIRINLSTWKFEI